jgi:hypothetical protein
VQQNRLKVWSVLVPGWLLLGNRRIRLLDRAADHRFMGRVGTLAHHHRRTGAEDMMRGSCLCGAVAFTLSGDLRAAKQVARSHE